MVREISVTVEIVHDSTAHRFSVEVEGLQCELDYRVAGSVMTITHTGVPEQLAGRGIAAQLMRAALDAARAAGLEGGAGLFVCKRPSCSKHPEFEDLRFRASRSQSRLDCALHARSNNTRVKYWLDWI